MTKNFKWLLLVSLSFVACNNNNEEIAIVANSSDGLVLTAGSANFATYVALGDSFAAGYCDNALFKTGQAGSYPNVMAQQFALVGGGAFTTPFMTDDIGGFSTGGVQNSTYTTRLYFNGSAPVNVIGVSGTVFLGTPLTGPFNNMGVPGAKSFHLIAPGYGSSMGNPYFARFATIPGTTVIADAMVQKPTFFSLWIGGNDVLGYATSGGDGSNPITPPSGAAGVGFDGTYTALINALTSTGAKGVVANLPYVGTLPYFTTVPYNAVPLTAAVATQLNSAYAPYNGGLAAAFSLGLISLQEKTNRTIVFQAGQNPVVIMDEYLTDISGVNQALIKMRQSTSQDLLVLPSRSFIGTAVGGNPSYVNGVSVPLADKWVLSKDEIDEIKVATDAYNVTIQAIATAKGLAFVDTKTIMNQLSSSTGLSANGFTLTSTYVTGGAFSLDGVHPSPRGYALIANKFIAAINTTYGSNLKAVDLGLYRILYPANPLAF